MGPLVSIVEQDAWRLRVAPSLAPPDSSLPCSPRPLLCGRGWRVRAPGEGAFAGVTHGFPDQGKGESALRSESDERVRWVLSTLRAEGEGSDHGEGSASLSARLRKCAPFRRSRHAATFLLQSPNGTPCADL